MPSFGSVRLKLALGALAVAGLALLVEGLLLERIAVWAERERDSYPYVAGEDPIRLLLPSLFEVPGEDRILILGSSSAHEGILFEEVERAFPAYDVLTVGISSGTMDDVLLVLDLIERLHGPDRVPRTLILGVTYRLVANVPRRFGDRIDPNAYAPLHQALRRYGPFETVSTEHRSELVEKGRLGKLKAAFTLHTKKLQPRLRAGLAALAGAVLGERGLHRLDDRPWPVMEDHRRPFAPASMAATFETFAELGVRETLGYWLPYYRSPYYTAYVPPKAYEPLMDRLQNGWRPEQSWEDDEGFVGPQFEALRGFCERHGIRLFAVNLPENPITFELYPEGVYERYRTLLDRHLDGVPLLDLRDALDRSQFMDEVHPLHPVARREVTPRVIRFVREHTPPGFGR